MSAPRAGVVVLDFGRPDDAARAAASARAAGEDVRVLVVENGAPADRSSDRDHLRIGENRGFGGGMNAGLRQLLAEGCGRILLLNSDAVLEPGCLERLADALEDTSLAAVGPVILRESDGRVESRGVSVDLRFGRVRLLGHGEAPGSGTGLVPVPALSGAVMMMSRPGLEAVGLLDEDYFFSFEDVDWCLRARAKGLGVCVVLDARARHGGSRTIGRASADRLYYAARNHARFLETHRAAAWGPGWLPHALAAGRNLAHALVHAERPRLHAARSVFEGIRDAWRGRIGPRHAGERSGPPEPAALPRWLGVLLFLFALALRVPLLPRRLLVEGDGVHYATLARDILAGDASGLSNPYWSNLWPAVIAAVAWLTRVDVVDAGRIASLVAGCCLAPATAALAARTLGKSTGLVAGLLVAGHPWLIHFSTLVFTESLFALLLVMLLLSAVRRTGAVGAATTGVWAGLSLVTRPETHAAIAAVLLGFLAKGRSRRAEAVRQASLLCVVVLSFVLARALATHRYHGLWDFGGTKATANLFVGLAQGDQEKARVSTELTERDENALARKARDQSPLGVALANPGLLARHVAFNGGALVACSLRVFPFVPLVGGRPPPWSGGWPLLLVLWAVGLTSVALVGLAVSLRDGAGPRLLATTGVLYGAGLAPFVVHDRLVVALTPLFLVFLAHGVLHGTRRLLPARATTPWGLAAGASLLGLVSLVGLLRAPALDYAADPAVQREAGEWLAARYPQDAVLMTAAPSVEFYFHDASHSGEEVTLPWADYAGVLEVARRQDVSLLAIPEWHLRAVRHPAAAVLLHPDSCQGDLRLLATLGGEGARMLIYELRPRITTP